MKSRTFISLGLFEAIRNSYPDEAERLTLLTDPNQALAAVPTQGPILLVTGYEFTGINHPQEGNRWNGAELARRAKAKNAQTLCLRFSHIQLERETYDGFIGTSLTELGILGSVLKRALHEEDPSTLQRAFPQVFGFKAVDQHIVSHGC